MQRVSSTIPDFAGTLLRRGDPGYDDCREVWNAIVDRHPALIARCVSASDVAAAVRFARHAGLEIAVKCGGHSILGLSVPEGGLMIDLTPMSAVRVDPPARLALVQGGALLRNLDRSAEPHGLATTAGNVSHTGVGGLTLGGGMGWLARQFGLACDNVASYTVVTAEGDIVRASATENDDLFWGLRGGGGNFGIVTEFEFRLHPISHRVLLVDRYFAPADGAAALRVWRDLLHDAPREATLTSDVTTAPAHVEFLPADLRGQPVASVGYVWVGDVDKGRAWLETFRETGEPVAERVTEMSYVELQSSGDENHRHGKRRYAKGHYLTELTDDAIDAFLARGMAGGSDPDWSRMPNGGFQAYGGAIAEVGEAESAFSQRNTLIEFGCAIAWVDATDDAELISAARAYGAAIEPFASGVYVNVLSDEGAAGVRRAYRDQTLTRLADTKKRYDPDNVFHLNHNVRPRSDRGARLER